MSLLTEEAEEATSRAVPFFILGALIFIGYAIAQHLGWVDAVAITLAFWLVSRSVRMAGRPL